jgi:NAD(P)-dependent dehydrogenase (short-subunit alcohol dehydrogenase family)
MSPNNSQLTGHTALVTGSTAGLGAGIAAALADHGAFVVVSGRDEVRGRKVVNRIQSNGGRAAFVAADLGAGRDAVERLKSQATTVAGGAPLDILVNNAATIPMPMPTAEVPEQLLRDVFAVNIIGPFLLTGLIAPEMARRGGGVVINIGSINGLIGKGGSALYSATKATIHSLTKSWADEYGPSGVRVNTVAPGPTRTERFDESDDHIAPLLGRIPSRRMSTIAEIAAAVVFLASDDAANVHGATLSVDGGLAAI